MSVAGADAPDELPPWELEFKRKFSDSPTRAARLPSRPLQGFAKHLKARGDLPSDGG